MALFENRNRWRVSPATVTAAPQGLAPEPLPAEAREAIWNGLAQLPDDAQTEVTVPVWALRRLMEQTEEGDQVPAAVVTDSDRRIQYTVTLGTDGPEEWVHRLTVEPLHDGRPDPTAYRPPLASLARAARRLLTAQAEAESGEVVAMVSTPVRPGKSSRPSPEQLCADVVAGLKRDDVAERYGVAVGTVDQWLRAGRRDRPELPWPPRTRGPKPKNSGR